MASYERRSNQIRSSWHEEFVRVIIARELGIPVDRVKSGKLPAASLPDADSYCYQTDLYVEHEDNLRRTITIVDCKLRTTPVDQNDVVLVQSALDNTRVHKAMIVTNTSFTRGARRWPRAIRSP